MRFGDYVSLIPLRASQKDSESHPFGGCDRLQRQYQSIGTGLLVFEESPQTTNNQREFQIAVAFVPVEVLESYLEDLLDVRKSEAKLFIETEHGWVQGFSVCLAGLLLAMGIGLYAATTGASLVLSFALTVCIGFPFALLWYAFPKAGILRRMRLAQVVSQEISRRRGGDKATASFSSRDIIRSLMTQKTPSSSQGAALELLS